LSTSGPKRIATRVIELHDVRVYLMPELGNVST